MFYIRSVCLLYLLTWPLISFSYVNSSISQLSTYQLAGHGRAKMIGEIFYTPCAIDTGSRYQTVSLGVISAAEIEQVGHSAETKLTIHLINCSLDLNPRGQGNKHSFIMTFDGNSASSDLFLLGGETEGIGLAIRDESGSRAIPGQAMSTEIIGDGNKELNYFFRIEKSQGSLRAGGYYSVIRFKLEYY